MMLTFYRVEHEETGKGMYQDRGPMAEFEVDYDSHPLPGEDRGLRFYLEDRFVDDKEFFAFSDITQLKAWLYKDEYIEKLCDCGYVINVYETTDGCYGWSQAIFYKETATLIETIRLEDV